MTARTRVEARGGAWYLALQSRQTGARVPGMEPDGEAIRKAVRWISDQRRADPALKLARAIDEASQRFDLSPLEADFLWRALTEPPKDGGAF